MTKSRWLLLSLIILGAMGLWDGMATGAEQSAFILRLGHDSSESSNNHIYAIKFKEAVEIGSNNRIKVQIYPGAQLGSEGAMFEQIQVGALQVALGSSGVVALDPRFGVFELPYIFRNREHMMKVLDGPIGDEMSRLLISRNIKLLAYADHGFRVITNNIRPIVKPEDLKGMKIRTPPNKLRIRIFNAFGAAATPLPFPELFMALQSGVVDGQENPLAYVLDNSFYEVQKYVSLSYHVYSPLYVLMSEKFFQSLPKDLQGVVIKAGITARDAEREAMVQKNKAAAALLEQKGMKVNEVDTKAFIKASKVIWDEEEKVYTKKLIDKIVND